jgi:hypothetical protein
MGTFVCPGACLPVPPFQKPSSPQPDPPPTLFAGVGTALVPPSVVVVGRLGELSRFPGVVLVGDEGVAILCLLSLVVWFVGDG